MDKVTEATRTVKLTDFVLETPPAILVSEMLTGAGGRSRLFTQKVQVTDAELWTRLTFRVRKEDTISVTVKTTWPDNGRYYTCLADFALLEAAPIALELAGVTA